MSRLTLVKRTISIALRLMVFLLGACLVALMFNEILTVQREAIVECVRLYGDECVTIGGM